MDHRGPAEQKPSIKKTLFYQYMTDYIKNYNKVIIKLKVEAKTIYQKTIQKRSTQHTIAGETQ